MSMGGKHRTQKHLFHVQKLLKMVLDSSQSVSHSISTNRKQKDMDYHTDMANFDKPGKGPRIKKNIEVHVSSLVRGVKTRSKRLEKGVGADFTPDGLRKKKESKHVENESTIQYKQFEKLELYHHMKKGDKEALQSYFKRTTPSDFAWRSFDDDGGVSLSVLGMHVEDLVDNFYLEGELLEYYMYKLDSKQKEEESQMQDSQALVKYSKSAFMKPGALELLQINDEDGVNEYIRDFILRIPDGVSELFIPIFTKSVSHWTLLHFNFSDHRWKHYNSLSNNNTKKACKNIAKLMMNACNFPIRQRNMNHRASISPEIDQIEDTPFSEPACTQQKKSDCLLFVCYYMKHIMRGEDRLPRERSEVLQKIKEKRIKMAVKLVTDKDHSNFT
ncbi:hypothetical protein MKW92_050383 [Papaver armeniacum]|nr:hypothetical protein MKW92_050383 [Papaver armeniacum]